MKKFKTATMKPRLFPLKGNFSKQLMNLHKPETSKDRTDRAFALKRLLGRLARTLFKLTALMIVGILFSVFVVWLSNNFIIGFFALIIIVLFWVGKIFWDDSANSA